MALHDPLRSAIEIREQLASEKRKIAFFIGAGTSMAVGLPGIDNLTTEVEKRLMSAQKEQFKKVISELPEGSNVENTLDRIRIYRELMGDQEEIEYASIKGATASRKLDAAICNAICQIVCIDPPKGLKAHLSLAYWLRELYGTREWPVEIFTTNYDLLLETAMEEVSLPFFDGFLGSVAPFFSLESVEAEVGKTYESSCPPKAWTRLWKIHGSVNWRMQKSTRGADQRITRLPGIKLEEGEELVIFPSREKYVQSRKLPFLAFQDRLRAFLSRGECLAVILGYSFSDEHLNEIIFQGLRSNSRLSIIALVYGVKEKDGEAAHLTVPQKILEYGIQHKNLSVYGPDKACIGGIDALWGEPFRSRKKTETWPFWDEASKSFVLGDFNSFAAFLDVFMRIRSLDLDSGHEESPSRESQDET